MKSAMIKALIKPILPKFAKWLKSQELTEGEVSSSVILTATGDNKVRIDICTMKVVEDGDTRRLAISRIVETFGEEEVIG